jgi:hypothetical protein
MQLNLELDDTLARILLQGYRTLVVTEEAVSEAAVKCFVDHEPTRELARNPRMIISAYRHAEEEHRRMADCVSVWTRHRNK